MTKRVFFIFYATLLLSSQLLAQDATKPNENVSVKTLNISDEQELYNSIKRVFFSAEHENIIDTNWSSLHLSKRVMTGFIDVDVEVQNVVLSTKPFIDADKKEMQLEIYSTQNDETTHYKSDSFIHKLFWNRLEYILGIQKEWINCTLEGQAIPLYNHLLCTVDKPQEVKEQ